MPQIQPKWLSEVKTGCVSLELSGRVVDEEVNLGVIHIVVAFKAGELNKMTYGGKADGEEKGSQNQELGHADMKGRETWNNHLQQEKQHLMRKGENQERRVPGAERRQGFKNWQPRGHVR